MEKSFDILIVDDNKDLASNLNDILKENGYRTAMAFDGQDAIKQCSKGEFSLALIDLKLPDINGLMLIEKLSKSSSTREYIIITAYSTIDNALKAVGQRKIVAFETKPLNIDRLVVLIQQISERRHAEQEREQAEVALRESEEKYRTITGNLNVGIYRCSPGGKFLEVNPAMFKMFGYKNKEEFLKIDVSSLYQNKKDREKFINKLLKEGLIKNEELRLKKKDGTSMICSDTAIAVRDQKGEILYFDGVVDDISNQKIAQNKLKDSLKEKEFLLQEIHHRVKNNMQVILSLIMLQYDACQEEKIKDLFQKTYSRVRAMCLVHEKLYKSDDYSNINIRGYIEHLVLELFGSYGIDPSRIQLELLVEVDNMNIKESLPLGLIINELVSNSLKYAFPVKVKRKGKIHISLRSKNSNELQLLIGDDGVGIPEHIDPSKSASLGLRMVNILVKNQLDGDIELNRQKGTQYTICFRPGK